MVYDYLPFMILPIYNSLSSIGDDVVEAGKDLGASYFTILRKIIFPLSLPGVISGITMVFVRFHDFVRDLEYPGRIEHLTDR